MAQVIIQEGALSYGSAKEIIKTNNKNSLYD